MSITQDDFKKIWASTSSVPEYTFSDSDYQDGWEFVGNLPPTRAMWDTLQRRNDQKMKYLQDNGSMCFDSVADMVATDLDEGQTVFTKGYHSINDGGSALYTIRAKDVADVEDGGSIIFLDNGNVAELITDGTVCPEQFGAVGDGTTDDSASFQNCLNAYRTIVLDGSKTYVVSGVDVPSNTVIEGNKAKLKCVDLNSTILLIPYTTHDVRVNDVDFECQYIDGELFRTVCVEALKHTDTDIEYEAAYNLYFNRCRFHKANMGFCATKATNVFLRDCEFSDLMMPTGAGSGGYGVLLQCCYNITIDNCKFVDFKNGRHDIYISSLPVVMDSNNLCKNITVRDCLFDHTTVLYHSPETTSVMVRSSDNVTIENCKWLYCQACVRCEVTNNIGITNLKIIGNLIDSPQFRSGYAEDFIKFNVQGVNGNIITADVSHNRMVNTSTQATSAVPLIYAQHTELIAVDNYCDGAGQISAFAPATVMIDGFETNIADFTNRFDGNGGQINGYLRNVVNKNAFGTHVRQNNCTFPLSFYEEKACMFNNNVLGRFINVQTVIATCTYDETTQYFTIQATSLVANSVISALVIPNWANAVVQNVGIDTANNKVTFQLLVNGALYDKFDGIVRFFGN